MIIVTKYNDAYAPYKPFWEYCIRRAYPDYSCHAGPAAHPAIERLLIEPFPSGYSPELQTTHHDYHYITDIDMMIMPETPSLKEFHIQEMRESGLCYSNTPRGTEERGADRVTGLHFCNLDWFSLTNNARRKYLERCMNGEYTNRIDDELILMRVIKESGLEVPRKRPLMKRHHGIHFGTLRAYKSHDRKHRFEQLRLRISPERAKQWQEISKDMEFESLLNDAPEWLVEEMLEMHIFTRTRAKQCS